MKKKQRLMKGSRNSYETAAIKEFIFKKDIRRWGTGNLLKSPACYELLNRRISDP